QDTALELCRDRRPGFAARRPVALLHRGPAPQGRRRSCTRSTRWRVVPARRNPQRHQLARPPDRSRSRHASARRGWRDRHGDHARPRAGPDCRIDRSGGGQRTLRRQLRRRSDGIRLPAETGCRAHQQRPRAHAIGRHCRPGALERAAVAGSGPIALMCGIIHSGFSVLPGGRLPAGKQGRIRTMQLRLLVASLLVAASGLGFSACGGSSDPIDPDSFVVRVGIGEPKRLIPSSTTESFGHDVLHALFTPLVAFDADFLPYEVAAESITSEDNQVWTIRLRPGWTFHNGEPVTADSYINAWNAGAWGPNAHDGNYFFEKIQGYADLNPRDANTEPRAKKMSGLQKIDDLTFQVTLNEPYVNFRSMLGYTAYHPLPTVAFSDVENNVI